MDWQSAATQAADAAAKAEAAAKAKAARQSAEAAQRRQIEAERAASARRMALMGGIQKWCEAVGIASRVAYGELTYEPGGPDTTVSQVGEKGAFAIVQHPEETKYNFEVDGFQFVLIARRPRNGGLQRLVCMRVPDTASNDGWSWVDVTTQEALGMALRRFNTGS